MVQILNGRPSFGSRFSESFNPAFQQGLNRFLESDEERERENRKNRFLLDKEERERGEKEKFEKFKTGEIKDRDKAKLEERQRLKEEEYQKLSEMFGLTSQRNNQGQPSEGQPSNVQQQGFNPGNLNDDQIAAVSLRNPQFGALLQKQKESAQKMDLERAAIERKPREKGIEGFFTKLEEDAEKLPALESSLESMLDAVNRGDVDPFSQSHFADLAHAFGAPEALTRIFQTPGSKEFNTARKTFLATTLKDAFRGATTGKEIELAESLLAQVGVKPES